MLLSFPPFSRSGTKRTWCASMTETDSAIRHLASPEKTFTQASQFSIPTSSPSLLAPFCLETPLKYRNGSCKAIYVVLLLYFIHQMTST